MDSTAKITLQFKSTAEDGSEKITEREIGLRFAFPCMRIFTEACFNNPDYTSLSDGAGAAKLIEAAYRNECLVKEIKPEYNYEVFYNWVEQMIEQGRDSEVSALVNQWGESSATKKSIESIEKKSEELKSLMMAV